MPSQMAGFATEGRKRRRPSVDGSYALQNGKAENTNSEQTEYFKPPTRNILSLPFELYCLVVSHLKVKKTDITALSQTCSTLHDRTIPLLYEDITIRVCPAQPLCVPPPLRSSKTKKKRRLTGGSGSRHDDAECTGDVHKMLHSRFQPARYVKNLRVVPAESDLPSWQYMRRVVSNSTPSTRCSMGSNRITRQESFISLNMAMLIEKMPNLATLRWEVDSFMGKVLQECLCKSSISSISVGASPIRNIHPTVFLHQDYPVVARVSALRTLICMNIANAVQLRQIGSFIGLNPHLKKVALGLQERFAEVLIPDGPEVFGIMIKAIVEAQWASPPIPSSPICWSHPLSLSDLRLSSFAMDEDAEKAMCFLISHCPLETLWMKNVAVYGDLSTFFGAWRRPEALSYLRSLTFETNTLEEHAIDFPALVSFLTYLGGIPHKLQSLVFTGGWRFLNMENAGLKALKTSKILDSLRTLIWESCVTKWCDDCSSARATRWEMSIFADVASCCHNIVVLGLPGLFISNQMYGGHTLETQTAAILHGIPRLRHLVHLHIQHTDRLQPQWSKWAMPKLKPPKPPARATGADLEYYVETSPKLGDVDFDDEIFRLVAGAIVIISLESSDITWDPKRRSIDTFSISFGVLKRLLGVWRTRVTGRVPKSMVRCGIKHGVTAFKGQPPVELIQQLRHVR